MKAKTGFPAGPVLLALLISGLLLQPLHADVEPGDVVNQSNHQKIEGLVPDFILEWVKNGDLIMKIGKLAFDPGEFWPQEVKDNWQANIGRYRVDENNGIVDAKTGEPVRGIKGLPFPQLDTSDPTLPVQLMWNDVFVEFYLQGYMKEIQYWFSVTRRGLEKTLILENMSIYLDPQKNENDYAQLTIFKEPFSIAGTGTLVQYPLYPLKNGMRFAYTPELRRTKRLPHRIAGSDVHFGLDNAPDDSWAGGPKTDIENGIYRFIGERDALVPYLTQEPRKLEWNEKGELETAYVGSGLKMKLGFEDPDWKGAPWHITDIVWVKTKVYVIESRSKQATYGYGPCEGWIEKGSLLHCYKRITDPSGRLWKGVYWPGQAMETPDGKFRLVLNYGWVQVDMRRDHGSLLCGAYREGAYRKLFAKDIGETEFTPAGFTKFYK